MNITTRDFGMLEIDEKEVIEFRLPIYGFETLKRFVLLYDDTVPGPFGWLQSLEDPSACFILVDPQAVYPHYTPELGSEIERLLELEPEDCCVLRSVTVIPEDFQKTTINLKSPVVINPRTRLAAQVILDAEYPVRARLLPEEEGGASC